VVAVLGGAKSLAAIAQWARADGGGVVAALVSGAGLGAGHAVESTVRERYEECPRREGVMAQASAAQRACGRIEEV
jgi:hypothetical protein